MGKITVIKLTDRQKEELKKGYQTGESHCFRVRCQIILLKSKELTAAQIAEFLECDETAVGHWMKRYRSEGIAGLKTRAGRGRKSILSSDNPQHISKVQAELKKNPRSIKKAAVSLENDLDIRMHPQTLKRFLKKSQIASAPRTNRGEWALINQKGR